jgi:hypothetical protein
VHVGHGGDNGKIVFYLPERLQSQVLESFVANVHALAPPSPGNEEEGEERSCNFSRMVGCSVMGATFDHDHTIPILLFCSYGFGYGGAC